MKILILTPTLPYPAHQGGALRNQGIIRGLAAQGHEITLLSFSDGTASDWKALYAWCRRVEVLPTPPRPLHDRLRDLIFTGQPDLAQRLISSGYRARLIELLGAERFDIVHIEGLELGVYLRTIREYQPETKIIYDAHNAEYMLQRGIAAVERTNLLKLPGAVYSQVQAKRIRTFEQEVCEQADAVIAVSEDDARSLRVFRRDRTVFVVPNGIFVDEYSVEESLKLGDHALVFTGKMDYRPNVDAVHWFVSGVLPRVRERVPDARLYVVGQKPHLSLHQLRSVDGVEITGWVAQVQPFLNAAQVYVAPLRMGSGTRLKILEAMASGKPVVATTAAAAGLNAETRAALIIADEAADFADRVAMLLQQPAERQRLGALARERVRAHYDWSTLIPCLGQIHAQLTGSVHG